MPPRTRSTSADHTAAGPDRITLSGPAPLVPGRSPAEADTRPPHELEVVQEDGLQLLLPQVAQEERRGLRSTMTRVSA